MTLAGEVVESECTGLSYPATRSLASFPSINAFMAGVSRLRKGYSLSGMGTDCPVRMVGSNINARPSYSATGRPSRVSARSMPR